MPSAQSPMWGPNSQTVSEIMTRAEIKSQTLNLPSHPGAPGKSLLNIKKNITIIGAKSKYPIIRVLTSQNKNDHRI